MQEKYGSRKIKKKKDIDAKIIEAVKIPDPRSISKSKTFEFKYLPMSTFPFEYILINFLQRIGQEQATKMF